MARAHRNHLVNLTGSALWLHLDPYAPWDSGVCVCVCVYVCVCVCVCDFLALETPAWGGRLCGLITKGDTTFLFPLGIEPHFPGVGENSVTSSEVLNPSVREAPPKTAEGDQKDGTSEPQ